MSYGVKFKLDFADNLGNPRRLEILKKNYSGSVNSLVGTANPVVIKWDSDDDIYTPIIGSTCELNLFVTDDTSYDNWYDADEREYKVRISTGDVSGGHIWNLTDDTYAAANFDWDEAGLDLGLEPYWEGFLIVDRYSEAVTSKPFPIKLVASDGLGTLSGFDAPFSDAVNISGETNPDPSATQSNFDNLFYYLRKILFNTGLDFDIYIANNIRSSTGANNETLFHDISVYEFGLLKDNFQRYDAKELLEHILKVTNSRVFQSNGRWYIISNSNIIDARLFTAAPTVQNLEFTIYKNTTNNELTLIGVDPQNLSLTFSIVDDVDNGSSSISNNILTYTPTNNFTGIDFFTYKANNGVVDSNIGRVDLRIEEISALTPEPNIAPPIRQLWKGNTIQQALSNARGFTNSYDRTHTGEFSSAYQGANIVDLAFAFAGSAIDASDETTWRYAGIGAKHLIYDKRQYSSTKGVSDPNIPTTAQLSNSYVYNLTDGYYAIYTRPLLLSSQESGKRFTYNISRQYSLNEMAVDFKEIIQVRGVESHYIAVFRVINSEIVERYSFAR